MSDVIQIHDSYCTHSDSTEVQLSCDGVSETKSTLTSLDVYSIRFIHCRNVYPLYLIRPLNQYPPRDFLKEIITELHACNLTINSFLGDNPKRSIARHCLSHSSSFPCEYCFNQGALFRDSNNSLSNELSQLQSQINSLQSQDVHDNNTQENLSLLQSLEHSMTKKTKKKTKTVWPANTRHGEPRTKPSILAILADMEANPTLSKKEKKGIVSKSPFLDLPYFDFVLDMPVDYMHTACLGVVKKLIELCFTVGEVRPRVTNRKLSSTAVFNDRMATIKVPREFSRRGRSLNFSVMKAQEFRNIILFFFPFIIACFSPRDKEIKLWLLLSYTLRACILPSDETMPINFDVIGHCADKFYILYEQLFGSTNCTYNTHVLCSHILEMRRNNNSLTNSSCFGFENFYSSMRRSYVPGTSSPLKQILSKTFLHHIVSTHHCLTPIFYSPKDTHLQCNSLVYQFVNEEYHFFHINSIEDDNISCSPLGKQQHTFPGCSLNWSKIGVFKTGAISNDTIIISKSSIHGKVLRVSNLLITCPNNVLREK